MNLIHSHPRQREHSFRLTANHPTQPIENPGAPLGFLYLWSTKMADYFSPTVIQQTIPNGDMTPLELLLLSNIFSTERDGDGWYFFAEESTSDVISVGRAELETALAASKHIESEANVYIEQQLAAGSVDESEVELDLSMKSWGFLFQDIIRRSSTLSYVTAVTSFTCSKMRSDGFGGLAMLITADVFKGKSTDEILYDYLSEVMFGPLGVAPGFGVYVLLRLSEEEVRAEIPRIIEADENLTLLGPDAITDDDIREGCLVVAERTDMSEAHGSAVFRAAVAAIRLANLRPRPSGRTS
jgi:hypothetical protein